MPIEAERALKKEAMKKFGSTTSKRARAYIWGSAVMKKWRKSKNGGIVSNV